MTLKDELLLGMMVAAGIIAIAGIGAACQERRPPKPAPAPYKPYIPPVIVEVPVRVPVPCMERKPAVAWPTWPDADKMGNVVMHGSTVDGFKSGIGKLEAYIDDQQARCFRAAASGLEPSDVERE